MQSDAWANGGAYDNDAVTRLRAVLLLSRLDFRVTVTCSLELPFTIGFS